MLERRVSTCWKATHPPVENLALLEGNTKVELFAEEILCFGEKCVRDLLLILPVYLGRRPFSERKAIFRKSKVLFTSSGIFDDLFRSSVIPPVALWNRLHETFANQVRLLSFQCRRLAQVVKLHVLIHGCLSRVALVTDYANVAMNGRFDGQW